MAYNGNNRLLGERASKIGHTNFMESNIVNDAISKFRYLKGQNHRDEVSWLPINISAKPFNTTIAVDGSYQTVSKTINRHHHQIAYIQVAQQKIDGKELSQIDQISPNQFQLNDIMTNSVKSHCAVLPLSGIGLTGPGYYDGIRRLIYNKIKDPNLNGNLFETLKWLAYEKYNENKKRSPNFNCPHCDDETIGLAYDSDTGSCSNCHKEVFLTDMIGFHLEMGEDATPTSLAQNYMLILEVLLLFNQIRVYWSEQNFSEIENTLFIKDGPLLLRGQYAKLINPIRNFIEFSKKQKREIFIFGQEKSGTFVNHLDIIAPSAPTGSFFLPDSNYIRKNIQFKRSTSYSYGFKTNYGNKLFVNLGTKHNFVLSVPTGKYNARNSISDLIGIDRIFATLPTILSQRRHNALFPIEHVNQAVSLSNYPSANTLSKWAFKE
tara:strand:+ start:3287 stop:4591 length:1305 start_codon:yes stop_codon:yes gene_type:complete